jgi:plastocyanin
MRRLPRSQSLTKALGTLGLAALLMALLALPALAAAEVRLTDEGFSPRTVRVDPGEEIVWVNATDEEQTVVGEDGSWDSGPLQPGETFSVALREPGTFGYTTADGEHEGVIRVRPPADEVAAESDEDDAAGDDGDGDGDDDDEVAAAPLPQTGEPLVALAGWGVLLVGVGFLAFDRAQLVRARHVARYGSR